MTYLRIFIFAFIACASAVHVAIKNGDLKTSQYCIVLDSDIFGTVYYKDIKNNSIAYDFVVNGTSVSSSGSCHDVMQNNSVEHMEIFFLPNDMVVIPPARERWMIKLTFEAVDSVSPPIKAFKVADYELVATFYPDNFNTTDGTVLYRKTSTANLEWSAQDSRGFSCSKSQLPLENDSEIVFSGLKVVAFALFDNDTFPSKQLFEQCQLDVRTSDLVPIIVGACLAGLVIVVLIAYIIGRARAKRQGYASV